MLLTKYVFLECEDNNNAMESYNIIGLKIQKMWDTMAENFNGIGIGIYELYYNRNPKLAHEVGANTYPQFIAVVAERTIRYKGEMSERAIRDFMATILPHHLITPVRILNSYIALHVTLDIRY